MSNVKRMTKLNAALERGWSFKFARAKGDILNETEEALVELANEVKRLRKGARGGKASGFWKPRALAAETEVTRLSRLLNTPEINDFAKAVALEAAHQRERWGSSHDAEKTDGDWFWLIGYLAGKVIRPGTEKDKKLHRIITIAAAACNWHAAVLKEK